MSLDIGNRVPHRVAADNLFFAAERTRAGITANPRLQLDTAAIGTLGN